MSTFSTGKRRSTRGSFSKKAHLWRMFFRPFFLSYPHALHHLELLQIPEFRANMKNDAWRQMLDRKQYLHWRTWYVTPSALDYISWEEGLTRAPVGATQSTSTVIRVQPRSRTRGQKTNQPTRPRSGTSQASRDSNSATFTARLFSCKSCHLSPRNLLPCAVTVRTMSYTLHISVLLSKFIG